MADENQLTFYEKTLNKAFELPYCKVDRNEYLTKQLKGKVSSMQLSIALEHGTVNAEIPASILDDIAQSSIKLETTKVTTLSTIAGLPGGFTMFGTVPADLVQFYAHVFRIAQKLAYIYGEKEIEMNDATENILVLYLGVMTGVGSVSKLLAKFAAANAVKIGTRVASKPLTKYALFNISKKVLAQISVKLTKNTVGKTVTKGIPIVSGILSGAISVATFIPMANLLQKELSKYSRMSPEELAKENEEADLMLSELSVVDEEAGLIHSEFSVVDEEESRMENIPEDDIQENIDRDGDEKQEISNRNTQLVEQSIVE